MSCADHLFLHSEDGGGGSVLFTTCVLVEVNIKELG